MSQSDAQSSPNYVSCRCQHCGGGIEFDAAELAEENSIVPCPHCGLETKLFVTKEGLSQPPITNPQSSGENETVTKARMTESMAQRDAQLRKIEDFLKESETKAIIWSNLDRLELAGDKVIICRRGVANTLAAGLNGERTIFISTLTSVQMKPGGLFAPGYILFSYAGSKPFVGGIFAATQDPDAFIFGKELNEQVADFKAKVEKIMQTPRQTPLAMSPSVDFADELRKLAELKQQGLLSQEEIDAAKKKLLS